MATKEIKICDCCKNEAEKSSEDAKDFGFVHLNFKSCYRLQLDYSQELCGLCAAKLKEVIENKLKQIRGGK
jgi:hypothetical protein